ncbi:MFS transporter [Streptomyces mutabilis]|uniref:MFS transporter n=1 Tax=Streptomyces mutabilis TaxID=67332 RepID=UPI0035EDEA0F
MEWYDWYAYTFLATYIADQVFPKSADNSLVPLLSTFAVFAVGFFMRPVGGLLMGVVADRRGRRAALTVTILLMGGSSLLVGLTPTYSAAGVLAPVILVAARLLQGLSWAASSRPRRPSWWSPRDPAGAGCFSSFQYVSTTAGQLVASGVATVLVDTLSEDRMNGWGWRVPFVLGAVLSLVGFWIRQGAEETRSAEQQRAPRPGLFEALRRPSAPVAADLRHHGGRHHRLLHLDVVPADVRRSSTPGWTSRTRCSRAPSRWPSSRCSSRSADAVGPVRPPTAAAVLRGGLRPASACRCCTPCVTRFAVLLARAVRRHDPAHRLSPRSARRQRRKISRPGSGGGHRLPLLLTVALFAARRVYVGTLFRSGHSGLFPWYGRGAVPAVLAGVPAAAENRPQQPRKSLAR